MKIINETILDCVILIGRREGIVQDELPQFARNIMREYNTGNLDNLTIDEFVVFCQGAGRYCTKEKVLAK